MKSRPLLYIIFIIVFFVGLVCWKLFGPTINEPEHKYLYIPTNATFKNVTDSLVKNKITNGTWWFKQVAHYSHYDRSIRPGRYKITNGMSLTSLVRMLRSGTQAPVNLVITKLRTKEDLAKKIGDNFECDSASVIK